MHNTQCFPHALNTRRYASGVKGTQTTCKSGRRKLDVTDRRVPLFGKGTQVNEQPTFRSAHHRKCAGSKRKDVKYTHHPSTILISSDSALAETLGGGLLDLIPLPLLLILLHHNCARSTGRHY